MRLLVLDDQRSARRVLRHMLAPFEELEIEEASNLKEARAAVEKTNFALILIDIRLESEPTNRGGLEFLRWLRANGNATPAVMVTASTELAEIREAMRCGAQDYVLKDELSPEMLLPIVEGVLEKSKLQGQVQDLRTRVEDSWGLSAIVGSSEEVGRVRRLIERVAGADCPVLIRGETGTGKELCARAIHQTGSRRDHPFLAINCSALPGTLVESMIFGHERGAFTGADRRSRGHLEQAGAGTLLLDEIAEMPVELQAKLLRVLEDHRFRPLGSERELELKARVLASTHVDIEERIRDGRFREDLFYRLNVVPLHLPSLAERRSDIPELLQRFLSDSPRRLKFSGEALEWLSRRPWPGNVRELRNAIERLILLSENEEIDVSVLAEIIGEGQSAVSEIDSMARTILALPSRLGSKLDVIERAVLHHAIETCGGNKSAAARLVGLQRKSLERRWEKLSDRPAANSKGVGEDNEK